MSRLLTRTHQAGLTVVEMMVVIVTGSLILGLVFTVLNDYYNSNLTTLSVTTQANDTRTALRTMENNLSVAHNFASRLDPAPSLQGSNNLTAAWDFKGTGASDRVLIAKVYATSALSSDTNRQLLKTTSGGCGNQSNTTLLENTVIYFVRSGTLYRRTIVPTDGCPPGAAQKRTCTPSLATTAPCEANDAALLSNVSSFSIDYFTNTTGSTALDVYAQNDSVAASMILGAKAIKISLQTNQTISGSANTYSGTIRINKFNQL